MSAVTAALPLVTGLLAALLGAVVAYQGYRGYRRNGSRPMAYLALGTFLLSVGPLFAVGPVGGDLLPAVVGQLVAQAFAVVGLLVVSLALR